MGIKVTIEIECDEANEIIQHLNVIKSDLTKIIKQKNSGLDLYARLDGKELTDSNCYGDHKVKVVWE